MEQFATEEQQVEAIKRFWKENGLAIVIGAIVGLGGLWGWRYYNEEQITARENASLEYEQVVQNLATDDGAYGKALEFVNNNPESSYATLTAFQLAQQAVDRKDFEEAASLLHKAAAGTDNTSVQGIAYLRLARVQLEQGQFEQVASTLDKVVAESYAAQVGEIKGDMYTAQQMFDKARLAYSEALEKNSGNNLLKMKLDNLAVAANG